MGKRVRRIIVWGGVLLLASVLVMWDIQRRPMEEKEGRAFTVLTASAMPQEDGTVVSVVRSDFPELLEPADPTAELTYRQVEEMVRKAVTLGGLEEVLDRAKERRSGGGVLWVVLKPNIVELKTRESGVITDWQVAKAVVKAVQGFAPGSRVSIAEGGAWIPPERTDVLANAPWADVGDGFEVAGYRQLLEDEELSGIRLDIIDLNYDEAIETPVPGKGYSRDSYHVPKTLLDCDVLIDMPVLKIIGMVGMTNAMKNFIGIAPGLIYGWGKAQGYPGSDVPGIPHAQTVLDETIVDLTAVSGVDFTVVDAVIAMEKGKSDDHGGIAVRMNTIIAGADVVAVDAVSARLMGMNPYDIEYVTLAHMKGMGVGRLSDIRVVGQSIDEVARRFEKYPHEYGHYGQGNHTWLLKGPISLSDREQARPDPATLYPTPGEDGWSDPVYFHDDMIDLDRYYSDPLDCVAYAYAEFNAPGTQEAELWVGSDEGMEVWINGKSAYRFEGARRHHLPNERVPISIRKGRNACLVEVAQTGGGYDFSLKICEPEEDPRYDGNTVFGLSYYVPKTATSWTKELAAVDERRRDGEWYEERAVDMTVPGQVKLSAFLPERLEGAWIGLDEPILWGGKMEVQAKILKDRVKVRTDNLRRFHLKVEGSLARLGRSPMVDVDGFEVRVKKVSEGDWIEMKVDLRKNGEVKGWKAKKSGEAPEDQMVVGEAPETLTREGLDSPMGNFFTDAIRWATGADVAFQNNGGIRQDLEAGPVTVEEIFALNFPDELYTFEVTGEELLAILEHDVRDEKERTMQMSGLRYVFDRSRPEGSRIVQSTVDLGKTYTIAAEDYLCREGGWFFGGEVDYVNTKDHVVDAQVRYVRKMGKVDVRSDGRIEEIASGSEKAPDGR